MIEGRGLRKVMTNPLHKTAAKHFSGKIDPLTLDITQRVRDGEVIYPQDTFNNNIKTIVSNIATRIDGIDHQDLTLVYGACYPCRSPSTLGRSSTTMARYPYLTGTEHRKIGALSIIMPTTTIQALRSRRNLKIPVVGRRRGAGRISVLPGRCCGYPPYLSHYPMSHLTLDSRAFGNHWSLSKQSRLALQFIEYAKILTARGAKRIHIVLAAPSSIALNFGRRYDNRNLAQALVYQYEKITQSLTLGRLKFRHMGLQKVRC